ncbi:MAG: glycosyltransferase family 2 protein, partial [Nitrososphaerales archaeon]
MDPETAGAGVGARAGKQAVLISVLMPVYNTSETFLQEAIESVLDQTFDGWELVIVDDGSARQHVRGVLDRAAEKDSRVKVLYQEVNRGIVSASNAGLAVCEGQFVAFLDHDDSLQPAALQACADVIAADEEVDFIYTDEDRLDSSSEHVSVFLKPDWSPERLRSQMYVGHLSVFRWDLVTQVGGFRVGFDGSQDYDLALRVSEVARHIVHIPAVLYHWRLTEGSVSMEADPSVFEAARKAIGDHIQRIGMRGWVEQIRPEGVYRVHREVNGTPLVSIIIPTRGSQGIVHGENRVFVLAAVRSLLDVSTYKNFEVVVVADRPMEMAIAQELKDMLGPRLTLIWFDRPFNYAHKMNLGVSQARGEYVLLLNDDVTVKSPDWIEVLLGISQQK